jgi:hypothetical protein
LTGVLGLPLRRAIALLEREGVTVTAQETRSKKGVESARDARVVRQDILDGTHAILIYAVFKAEPNEANA